MSRENAHDKARRYLAEGRLVVTRVSDSEVHARARGDSGAIYRASFVGGSWTCTCPARADQCAHLRALRLVTAVS